MAKRTKHPAGPFTVRVTTYSLGAGIVGANGGVVYASRHVSPHEAGKRLATIISGKSQLGRDIKACIPTGYAGRYYVETGSGTQHALNPFRQTYCRE